MTATHDALVPARLVRGALIGVGGFNALSAIGGGIGLLTPGSMGLPVDVIAGSGFTSYFWPAILLIVVIGGTQLLAVIAEVRRAATALFWAAFAGFAMIIWIFVELAVMGGFSALHGIYFATGTLQLVLVFALLGIAPAVVGARAVAARR
ncbi:hypothetical protein ES5_02896 [Dietzia cinnamea P4]|nr:hypothetical protein ES5_02896 [Dietzia cinnamea P4]OAH57122.1 hypothetical protein AYJ66_15055 [Dietzia cinnamea]